MPFPVQPDECLADNRGLFLCQDPELRAKVLPLFSFNPHEAEKRPRGQGTAFRIDPWSTCATAFHVLEDLFDMSSESSGLVLRDNISLAALEVSGLVYGKTKLDENAWRPLSGAFSIFGVEDNPLTGSRLKNSTELMVVKIRPSQETGYGTPYLPVDLDGWYPSIDEELMAIGFADLDSESQDSGADRPIEQYMYMSIGRIIDIEPADKGRGRPWPRVNVDSDWPGGMSGGPVFNQAGNVVGIVSSGIGAVGVGIATFFSGWSLPQHIFGSLDPNNPSFFRCHAVFDESGNLVHFGQDEQNARAWADQQGFTDIGVVSLNPSKNDYLRVS